MKVEIEESLLLGLFEDSAILDELYRLGIKDHSIYGKVDLERAKAWAGASLKEAKHLQEELKHGRAIPLPGEIWHHFKNTDYKIVSVGPYYEIGPMMVVCVVCRREKCCEAIMDLDRMVGLKQNYKYVEEKAAPRRIWPLEFFMSEVDRDVYPNVTQQYQFERIQ